MQSPSPPNRRFCAVSGQVPRRDAVNRPARSCPSLSRVPCHGRCINAVSGVAEGESAPGLSWVGRCKPCAAHFCAPLEILDAPNKHLSINSPAAIRCEVKPPMKSMCSASARTSRGAHLVSEYPRLAPPHLMAAPQARRRGCHVRGTSCPAEPEKRSMDEHPSAPPAPARFRGSPESRAPDLA